MKNKLICGDNLKELSHLPSESADLIYIDPPFFSNRNYEIIWGDEAEIRTFEDRWEGGINVYVDWMRDRVLQLHRVLKPTGSFYLHCDWHAGHYLKCMCDDIFGYKNFQNEIIWNYGARATLKKSSFPRKHDNIFFYSKTNNHTYNEIFLPYKDSKMGRYNKTDEKGKIYALIKRKRTDGTTYYGKTYPREGVPATDVWDIPLFASTAKERLGYPTQKPEKLLERIIKASSNKGDTVLDAFCGCGTALAVAQKLNRQWIGIDISPSAIALIKNRLGVMGLHEIKDYEVTGMPRTIEDLKKFKPYEFQYWVINEVHGTPSPRKVGDMGIDGFSYLRHIPIQVKQSENIGRGVADNFETALRRYYKNSKREMKGIIIAFSFGSGIREEISRAKKDGFDIELVEVQDILDKNIKF